MNPNPKHLVYEKYSFKDLVNIDRLSEMFEHFSQATGFTTGLVSYPDQELLIGTGWRDICTKFHRAFSDSEVHCRQSNLELTSHLKKRKALNVRHCESGMVDGATPIIIKGTHVANLFTGQILFKEPDIEFFRKQGQSYGYDIDAYLEALEKVPVVTEDAFKKMLSFLSDLAVMLAEQGLTKIRNHETTQSLRESREFLDSVINSIADPIFVKDEKHCWIALNDALCRMFGFSRAEMLGKTDYDLFPKAQADVFWAHDDMVMASDRVDINEEEITGANRTYTISTIKSSFTNPTTGRKNIVGTIRDITELKRAEKDLSESEARLTQIVMGSPVPSFVIDNNHITTHWNTALEKVTGISGNEVIGTNKQWMAFYSFERPVMADLIVDNVPEQTVSDYYRGKFRKSTGIADAYEAEDFFPDLAKKGKWLFFTAAPLRNSTGEIIGSVETLQDTTDRKMAEQALKESEEKYRLLVEFASDAIFVAQGESIKFPNPKALDLIGYSAEELEKLTFVDLIHPEDRNRVLERYKRRLSGEELPTTYSFRVMHKTGKHLTVQINATQIIWEGRPATLNFLRDITAQKISEDQLRQSQKLEAIGTLAGGIAHDFNNILAGIFGYTQLLQIKLQKDSKMLVYLDSIFEAGNRAKELVKQILTFSRQSLNELRPIEIQLVTNEALKLIKSSIPSTISIRQRIQKDCGLVLADPTQIHQIIMNLCTNAYHVMEETGGELNVNLREIELAAEDLKGRTINPGKYAQLTVADTGSGIDRSVIDRIFDPYFTTKAEGKGTGLGLAVIHGIVTSHEGHIFVDSEPGKGTKFHIYLPVIKTAQETPYAVANIPIQKGNEHILLVDDQKDIVEIEQQLLEVLGYQVTAKTSSIEALDTFHTNPDSFDLVITDMTMPNMTGDKLSGELIKIRSDIPVILCTGFSEKISEKKAISLGIKGFAMKPLVLGDLSVMIRKIFDDK